jgi:hypothetical protein
MFEALRPFLKVTFAYKYSHSPFNSFLVQRKYRSKNPFDSVALPIYFTRGLRIFFSSMTSTWGRLIGFITEEPTQNKDIVKLVKSCQEHNTIPK